MSRNPKRDAFEPVPVVRALLSEGLMLSPQERPRQVSVGTGDARVRVVAMAYGIMGLSVETADGRILLVPPAHVEQVELER